VSAIDRKYFSKLTLLTVIWIIFREEFSLFSIVVGIVICIGCIAYSRYFLPLNKIVGVNYARLFLYVFDLIWQIYLSGFYVINMIIRGKARADIVSVKTSITNETLRVILADSITLTPGSILLDLTEDNITVVVLMSKEDPEIDDPDTLVKGNLEEKLLKAQR